MSKPTAPVVPLYFRNQPVTPQTITGLAAEFHLSVDAATQAVAQIRHGAVINYESFPEDLHERLQDLFEAVSTTAGGGGVLSPEDQLSEHATNGLIAALTADDDGHFTMVDGICEINPANPPQLEQAYLVLTNVLRLRVLGQKVIDTGSWMMGSLMAALRDHFGAGFDPGQVAAATTRSENTLYQAEKVFRFFKDRRYNLPYSSHQEARFADIPDESKHVVLRKAETYDLDPKKVRTLCSVVKLMGDDQTVRNIRSKEQAEALIDTYREIRVEYFVENDESIWSHIKTTADQIPTGVRVINLKSRTISLNGGEATEIPTVRKS